MFKNILRNFARRTSRKGIRRGKPFKRKEKVEKEIEFEDFYDEDDEDIYITEPTMAPISQNPVLRTLEEDGIEDILKLSLYEDSKYTERVFRMINSKKTNLEILEKLKKFPDNYIKPDLLNENVRNLLSEIDPNEEDSLEDRMKVFRILESLRAENALKSISKTRIRKIMKKISKHANIRMDAFKSEVVKGELLSDGDLAKIDHLTSTQFDKYSGYEDETAERLEEVALERYVDTLQDSKLAKILEEDNSILMEDTLFGADLPSNLNDSELIFKDDNFGLSLKEKSDIEARRVAKKLGMPYKEAQRMMKEYVFMKKKEEEENLKFKEARAKAKRKKEIRNTLKDINKPNFDFNALNDQVLLTKQEIQDKFQGSIRISKHTEIHPSAKPIKERAFDIYKYRTVANMKNFVEEFLVYKQPHILEISKGRDIVIEKIDINDGITVLELYWNFLGGSEGVNLSEQKKREIRGINSRLTGLAMRFLSKRIFVEMGLKKGVEIRFFYSFKEQIMGESRQKAHEMAINLTKTWLDKELKEGRLDQAKGDLTNELIFEKINEYKEDILDKIELGYNEKRYKGMLDENHGVRKARRKNHRDEFGRRNRHKLKKSDKAEQFWGSLEG